MALLGGGSNSEILVKIKSTLDKTGFTEAQSAASGLGTTMKGLGLTAIGAGFAAVGKEAVSAAVQAEQGWMQFGNAFNNTGGNWEQQSTEIKQWVKDYSNSMGRAVGDTRTAMTTFLQAGMSLDESKKAMEVTSNMAAQMGMDQASAAQQLQLAFQGNGRALKKLGLNIADYKDKTTGAIDKTRLMNDIMSRTGGAAGKYADSAAGKMQKVQNQIASMKTQFGEFIVSALEPLLPVAQQFLSLLNSLPAPVKTVAFGVAALAGGFALLSGPITTAIGLIQSFGGALGKLGSSTGGIAGSAGGSGGKEMGQGIVKTLEGLKGFGRAMLALVPDIVMAGAAIAVVIAVVAALAAEVIVLTKGIQLLVDAMKFGDVKLDDDIEGLKKLGEAMKQIAIILGAMVIANVSNIAAQVSGGILNLAVGLATIKKAYGKVKEAVDQIKGMGDIDQAGLDKLKKLGDSLKSLGNAAQGLNNINQSMNLGSVINNVVAFLTGGSADVGANIQTLIDKIRQIAPKLNQLATLPDIDQGGVDKIKKIGDAVQNISNVMKSIGGVQGGLVGGIMDLWQGSFTEQFDKMFTVIQHIGSKLSALGSFSIPDTSWIQRVGVALSYLKGAMNQLNNYANMQINTATPEVVGRAVTAVKMVAQQLQGLSGAQIGDVNGILSQIQQAIQQMKATLAAANFNAEGVNIGNSLTQGVQQGLSGLPGVVTDASNQAVSAADGTLPPGMGNVASNATNNFRNNLKLADVASQEMNYAVQAINSGSGALAQAAADAAKKAVDAAKNAAGQHSPGYIAQAWGDEFGKFSPQKINEGTSNLLNTIRSNTTSAVKTAHSAQNLNSRNPGFTGAAGGNVYNVGANAFNITVKDMTATEAKNIIVTALESL